MSNLSDFTKEIIRECAEHPKTNVYFVYAEVMRYCPKSSYTIEQVGKYLRRVKRSIMRSHLLYAPVNNHTQKERDVALLLTNKTTALSKNPSTPNKREELEWVSERVF